LRRALPAPSDDAYSLITNPQFIIWSPVSRTDISWNFEKFLIDHEGRPVKRYSKNFETINIAADIEELIKRI
jgi:glutathione peroxidase